MLKTRSILWFFLCLIGTYLDISSIHSMDYNQRRALENEVRSLRNLKNPEGKSASYIEIQNELQKVLESHNTDPEALRVIYSRFFWDVARNYRRDIGDEGLRTLRDAYVAISNNLDDIGMMRHRMESHRMLTEFDRETYLAEAEPFMQDVFAWKEKSSSVMIDFLTYHMDYLWRWKMGPETLTIFTKLATEFPEDETVGWKLYEKSLMFLRDYKDRGPLENILAVIDPLRERLITAMDRERSPTRKQQQYTQFMEYYANLLLKVNRAEEALALAKRFTETYSEEPAAWFLSARCLQLMNKPEDAKNFAQKAILLDSTSNTAFSAQSFLVDQALDIGDMESALGLARILFDVAADEKQLGTAVQKIATVFSTRDGHLANANAFLLFQKSGATAEGAKRMEIPRKSDSAFESEAVKRASEMELTVSPDVYRRKALLYLYAGKPDEALTTLMHAYRILDTNGKSVEKTISCMAAAYRAKTGELLAAEPFLVYQEFGPAGPDGMPGNQDDLANPYPALQPIDDAVIKAAETNAVEAIRNAPTSNTVLNALLEYGSVLSIAGRFDEALSVARAAYNTANESRTLDRAVMAVASALRVQRGQVAFANQYIEFQRYGKAGKDEQTGTADDLTDPLTGMALALPESFVANIKTCIPEREQTGDWRAAGYLRLILGDAAGALAAFKKDRSRMAFDNKGVSRHFGDVLAALKARDGHSFGGEGYVDFQRFGPAGQDGIAGTKDDLLDPLAKY